MCKLVGDWEVDKPASVVKRVLDLFRGNYCVQPSPETNRPVGRRDSLVIEHRQRSACRCSLLTSQSSGMSSRLARHCLAQQNLSMLDDIKKTLWATADKLRANMDAAEYKHLVLGLIFLKYISDTFAARRAELTRRFGDEADDYFLHDCDNELLAEEVEDDDEAFADKMQKLTEKLGEQMAKGAELDALIRQKLGGLGYDF